MASDLKIQVKGKDVKNRKLTVGSKFYPQVHHKYVAYPQIMLIGKWLQNIGFIPGSVINVQYTTREIIIKPDEPDHG